MPEGRLGHDSLFANKNAQNPPEFSMILDIVFLYTYSMPKGLRRASDFGHCLPIHLFYAQRSAQSEVILDIGWLYTYFMPTGLSGKDCQE